MKNYQEYTKSSGPERVFEHGANAWRLVKRYGVPDDIAAGMVDFSANINPYGPPHEVVTALKQALDATGAIADYPEEYAAGLCAAIADKFGLEPDNVVVGNGSAELLRIIPYALLQCDSFEQRSRDGLSFARNASGLSSAVRACIPIPNFSEYRNALDCAGITCVAEKSLNAGDTIRILSEMPPDIGLVMLGNPNNPCGYLIPKADMLGLIDTRKETLFVIDEAFIEFGAGENSLVKEAAERDNLVIARSMTKAYSLAGLRIGYIVGAPGNVARIRSQLQPWSINSLAIQGAKAALEQDGFLEETTARLHADATALFEQIQSIRGLSPLRPEANFVLVKMDLDMTAGQLQERLAHKGYAIRDCATFEGLDSQYFRIAVRRQYENNGLLEGLRDVFK